MVDEWGGGIGGGWVADGRRRGGGLLVDEWRMGGG